jgi:imidazolonepropionase-like amidohydrolase
MMKSALAVAFALVCAIAPIACAQDKPQAYTGATIIPISGPEIRDGVLVTHHGKIVSVGARSATQIPADAQTIDASGKVIMPGLVDSHSHIGSGSGGDNSAPIQPDVRILDSINVGDNSLKRARRWHHDR